MNNNPEILSKKTSDFYEVTSFQDGALLDIICNQNDCQIPSLQEICSNFITHSNYFRTLNQATRIYCTLMSDNPIYDKVYTSAYKFLENNYPVLSKDYSYDELIQTFSKQDLEKWKVKFDSTVNAKKQFAIYKGKVLEPEPCNYESNNSDEVVPLEYLLDGIQWPKHVNPSRREQYLSSEEFGKVFKMNKDEFNQLSSHVKLRLKKENRLF